MALVFAGLLCWGGSAEVSSGRRAGAAFLALYVLILAGLPISVALCLTGFGFLYVVIRSRQAPRGIRSNVVSPGLVLTPLSAAFYQDPEVRQARERHVPLGRIGDPQDMADVALYFASPRAGYVTGQEIIVDGGLSQTLMANVPRPGYAS
ncbi:SDR family NAD(P)-dependent oxidoreductase [Pseudodonghicola sp.]|uniref:SDR family NAD(P)-dependent oxidoreductase n=1 Tax=Pseudodonghicola sp. TaxID=1969463 RepID=UPI003A988577